MRDIVYSIQACGLFCNIEMQFCEFYRHGAEGGMCELFETDLQHNGINPYRCDVCVNADVENLNNAAGRYTKRIKELEARLHSIEKMARSR